MYHSFLHLPYKGRILRNWIIRDGFSKSIYFDRSQRVHWRSHTPPSLVLIDRPVRVFVVSLPVDRFLLIFPIIIRRRSSENLHLQLQPRNHLVFFILLFSLRDTSVCRIFFFHNTSVYYSVSFQNILNIFFLHFERTVVVVVCCSTYPGFRAVAYDVTTIEDEKTKQFTSDLAL